MGEETATVRVAEGLLRGRRVESKAGGTLWSFQGIRYARAPVGPLRFKDAQAPESWEGVRDAFEEGDCCAQFNFMKNKFEGSDDCLFMNVYTRHLPARKDKPLPVMVFIHGGGFEVGSGEKDYCGPDYLVAEDVIMVSFNYRVGVLGFLFLEEASPGNVGLKDQVAALRWVQKNIAAFGGDPGNVTLFGPSAGAVSVHLHTLSPMSKGLFHRVIACSGAALNPWAHQTEPAGTTRRLARAFGCTSDDPHTIVEFLRGVDHKELVRLSHTDAAPEKDKARLLKFSFVPTPERVVPGVETFLPASAEQLMKDGCHYDVPYMTGITEKEALMILKFHDFRNEDVARELDANWNANILTELRLPTGGSKNAAALDALRKFYMDGKPLSNDTIDGYIDMLSDLTFGEGIMNAIRNIVKKSTAPVFLYVFSVDDQLNAIKAFMNIDMPGASHGDDLGYILHIGFVPLDVPEDSSAARTRRRMVRMLTNFAKTGDPTPEDDPLIGVRWKPYTKDEKNFLSIENQLQNRTDPFADRAAFWETFYEKYGS
ncbi:hypothetical protein R5R35_006664 [Gryllus longicercus]|uniref:Carboxylic ester hydrolase n=1 Tax=Gryllus longicercus TaxID=2509291 RepID=A0AAN9W9N9_9ORTH